MSFCIFEMLKEAQLQRRNAERWRAASKLPEDKFSKFKEKLRTKGELLKPPFILST